MLAAMDMTITKAESTKLRELDLQNVPFGKFFSDHMLEADFVDGEWKNFEIKPFQPMLFLPSLAALHYGQAIFEGIKAYRNERGEAFLVRPFAHYEFLSKNLQ